MWITKVFKYIQGDIFFTSFIPELLKILIIYYVIPLSNMIKRIIFVHSETYF